MKTLILILSLAAAGVSSADAQLFQPVLVRDGVVGAVAGALIGGHNHNRWGEGAVIGAAVGSLIGATVDQPRAYVSAAPVVLAQPAAGVVYVERPAAVRVVYVQPQPAVVFAPAYAYGYGYRYYAPVRYAYAGYGRRHW